VAEPEGGVIKRAEGRVAYLSQRLDLLDAERWLGLHEGRLRESGPLR
jgi:hypothetical protein